MVDFSEIMKLKPRQLKKIQAISSFLRVLGLTDEEIKSIPEIIKNWPTIVKNMNHMVVDVANIKTALGSQKSSDDNDSKSLETPDNIKESIGFGVNIERVDYSKCNSGGGMK